MNERRKFGGGQSFSGAREKLASLSPQTLVFGSLLLAPPVCFILRIFTLPGNGFWSFRRIGRGFDAVLRGDFSAPDATSVLFLLLAFGAPVLGLSTLLLRERLWKAELQKTTPAARGCFGLLAGAVLFTVTAPLAFLSNPVLAVFVGGAFFSRALTLLPARGGLARERFLLLVGVAVYWLFYWAYETPMEAWSRSVSGAIRVDIVVFYPLLYLVSACGVWLTFDRWSKGRDEKVQPGLSGRVGV